eukprot:701456-Rhodomonas_salina.2
MRFLVFVFGGAKRLPSGCVSYGGTTMVLHAMPYYNIVWCYAYAATVRMPRSTGGERGTTRRVLRVGWYLIER